MDKPINPARLESAATQAVRQRNYRRARDRALTRLANDHREEYLDYLKQEQERDHREGRRWLDIAGNTSSGNSIRAKSSTQKAYANTNQNHYEREDEGD